MISVIVPVYKTEQYLERCVDSILNQTYENIEVILVDDGSPDKCSEICDRYANKDRRVKVIHKKNGGVSTARNEGLDIVTGDYVTFVDSDDYIECDMYEKMLSKAVEYECDVVMCDCIKDYAEHSQIYTHNIRSGFYDYQQLLNEYYPHLLMMENVEYPASISNVTILWKSTLNTKDMRYEPNIRFSEDLLFGAKLLRKARSFYYMKGEALYHYVFNESSASHTFADDKWDDYNRLYECIKKEFSNDPSFDFSYQIDLCILFFVYNTIGEIYSLNCSSLEKQNRILEVLNTKNVEDLFKRISICNLNISKKLRIITFIYKYRVGLALLIKYCS